MELSDFITQTEQCRKEQDALYHQLAVRFGLTDTTMLVLYLVSEAPSTQQELCRRSFYAKQTIHSALATLIRQGYARLEPVPGGRKQKRILLTEQGQALSRRTTDLLHQAELQAYGSVGERRLEEYLTTTEAITAALRKELGNIISQGDQT